MRQKFTPQMSLFAPMARNSIVKELEQMSKILDANPNVLELVYQDLVRTSRPDTGRQGLTAEQVLRCAVLKQYRELTYEELAFHLEDSDAFRTFSRLEMGQYPSKSILQENIKAIREETWEAIHCEILGLRQQGEDRDRQDGQGRLNGGRDQHPSSHRLDSSLRRHPHHYPVADRREGTHPPTPLSVQRPPAGGKEEGHGNSQCPQGYGTSERLPGPSLLCRAGRRVCP